MTKIENTGVYEDIHETEYHADPCPEPSLSSSVAKLLVNRSPAHAWVAHPRLNPDYVADNGKSYTNVGSAVHAAALDGDWSRIEFVDAPDFRTKAAREMRDSAISEHRYPLLEKQRQQIEDMVATLIPALAQDTILTVAGKARLTESVFAWQENGAWIRTRPDLVQSDMITDVKTTGLAATDDGWGRKQIWEYAMQAGLYRRGYAKVLGDGEKPRWRFVVQEQDAPYAVAMFEFDSEALDYCDRLAERAVQIWSECISNNEWPSYPTGVHVAEMPAWLRVRSISEGDEDE